MRVRRVDCASPGIRRIRRGRGFGYVDPAGGRLTDPQERQRIRDLAIPPAWQDVWICPLPNGHIQATGTDAAGRRQYIYHDAWRTARDREKHQRMLAFARRLPTARRRIEQDLAGRGYSKRRVLAAAARLLDLGFFRIGSEEYAEDNGSFGLATMRREDVSISRDGVITFDYIAKGGARRVQSVAEPAVCKVVAGLTRRHSAGNELLAFRDRDGWHDIKSHDINGYLAEITRGEFTAKDFRTWHATVLCAVGLAVSDIAPASESGRNRAVSRAIQETAHYLGNTASVCRSAYVDPRVIDRFTDGRTIRATLDRLGADANRGELATQGAVERAVLRLLS